MIALWQRIESVSRRLAAVDHALVAQAVARQLEHRYGARSVAALLRDVLRVGIGEASARVRAAAAAGPRTALTGEALPPVFAQVAAAQACGGISPAHARLIVATVDALPDVVAEVDGEQIEQFLVDTARGMDPDTLGKVARRLLNTLDPDGRLKDRNYRERHRELRLRIRPDGSSHLEADLTAEATEHLRTVLDSLAMPRPAAGTADPGDPGLGLRDTRSAGQRRHDALLDVLLMAERAKLLPDAGGVTTTVILTATAGDWVAGTGTVTTGHGAVIATSEAQKWAGDQRLIGAMFDKAKAITHYSSSQRIFTEGQRLALIARDRGCSFPNCDAPPQFCQAHHVIDWADGGPTSIDNGTLLYALHHREFSSMGWAGTMINGRPHWRPPPWIDRHRTPRRNQIHHPAAEFVPSSRCSDPAPG